MEGYGDRQFDFRALSCFGKMERRAIEVLYTARGFFQLAQEFYIVVTKYAGEVPVFGRFKLFTFSQRLSYLFARQPPPLECALGHG